MPRGLARTRSAPAGYGSSDADADADADAAADDAVALSNPLPSQDAAEGGKGGGVRRSPKALASAAACAVRRRPWRPKTNSASLVPM
ncbi:hypothetical protein ACIPPS_25045 [Streptomyces sp. NPDC090127]|uniref:hypothetical protein n=1 Tax=Streptomyces sp. NPDC090127 TaxID=3365953 RepID=UPI00382BCF65